MGIKRLVSTSAVASMMFSTAVQANDEMFGAFMGAVIGSAITQNQGSNTRSAAPSAPSRSPAEIAETRQIQEALNYFGFPAGTPDGILGRGTRSAISQYQAFIGYAATGNLLAHEKTFLINSFNRAAVEPPATIQQALANPMGLRSLLQRYAQPEASAEQRTVSAPSVVNTVVVDSSKQTEMTALQDEVDNLADQVALLEAVIDHQRNSVAANDPEGAAIRVSAVMNLVQTYNTRMSEVEVLGNEQYSTPIRPQNANQGSTARRLSEVFPKVPYYIAGTDETGEMWVEPQVTDAGFLEFGFNFIDPLSEYDQIRDTISFTSSEIEAVSDALTKVYEWTEIAQQNEIRRNHERLVTCLPDGECENLREGVSSNAVVFQIYEDGSTAAKLRRNRGMFVSNYNLSVESGLMLAAYLDYMREVGMREFTTGTMTEDDIDALFE